MRVVYGTSDYLPNFGEMLLTLWAAERMKGEPIFFYYPKDLQWMPWEKSLFEPYQLPDLPPEPLIEQLLRESTLKCPLLPLQKMAEGILHLTLGEIAELIREKRQIKSFRAVNLVGEKPVYVSSKDPRWREWSSFSLEECFSQPVKLGGSIIYFVYGHYLAINNQTTIGILPYKEKPDVIGAFRAGEELAGKQAFTFPTGEFDFMTLSQWKNWEKTGQWRKVPPWVIPRLLADPIFCEELKEKLFVKKEYCPVVYDEKGTFYYFYFYKKEG